MTGETVFGPLSYAVLAVYFTALVLVGLVFAGRQKTVADFFLAGRNMPWLMVGMSIFASIISAVTYLAVPGLVYEENVSIMVGICMMPFVAPVIIVLFLPFYQRLHVTTSYEYVDHRFGRTARYVVASLFVLARLGWLGAVVYAPALALSVATGLEVWVCIFIIGAFGTAYTVLGGIGAVILTDVMQFCILAFGAVWVAGSLSLAVPGGIGGIVDIAGAAGRLNLMQWQLSLTEMTITVVAVSYFFQFMHDYGVDQVAVQRLLAAGDLRGMAYATLANALFTVVIVGLLAFIGCGLYAYHVSFPGTLPDNLRGDQVFPHYVMHQMPGILSRIVMAAIFAAALSGMDSGVSSLAAVVMNDFIEPLRGKVEGRAGVTLARTLTFIFGVCGTLMAFFASEIGQIMKASQTFLGLFLGPVLALFLLGMLTTRASFRAWAIGLVFALVATLAVQRFTAVHSIYYFPLSFFLNFCLGWLLSLVMPQRSEVSDLTVWRSRDLRKTN